MKLNLEQFSRKLALVCIAICSISASTALAGDLETFITKLQSHYKKTQHINSFSMTHNYLYLGHNAAYSSWDYKAPNRYTAFKVTEFDLKQEHYFEHVVHHYPGGKTFDEVHFQNNTDSFRYSKNGLPYGKRLVQQPMDDYQGFKDLILANIDFLSVRPLLEETDVKTTMTLHQDKISEKATLTHKSATGKTIEYIFGENPLRLLSLNNKSAERVYFYDDYQTTNDVTFARSIVQYTNGAMTPTFIKRIENIDIIKEIDPENLKVPKGYGPIIPERNRHLISKEIAPNLYLITDSSAWRNTLFKVIGDEIMVFGAPISSTLSEQSIKLINTQFPQKKIASVYITHPHSDHIAGLAAFAKRGIVVQADSYSIAAIQAYPAFADIIDQFTFQTIEHAQAINNAHFYVLKSTHTKQQSFVHFKDSGIIYQADFLDVPFDNTIPLNIASYTQTFIDFVRSKNLNINRIVGHHSNNDISVEVMNKLYNAIK